MLNKLSVSKLAQLSNLSKSYISQIKHGKRPPSQKLLEALSGCIKSKLNAANYYALFMQSRLAKEVTNSTMRFYEVKLGYFLSQVDPDKAKQCDAEKFLLQFPNPGNRHGYYQVIKTFYLWREQHFGLQNPMKLLKAPKVGKLIMPSLTREQVSILIEKADNERDKTIISLFTESGLRLSELTHIRPVDIDWQAGTIPQSIG